MPEPGDSPDARALEIERSMVARHADAPRRAIEADDRAAAESVRADIAEQQARIDMLTEIPNLRAFQEGFHRAAFAAERSGQTFYVVCLDMEDLKRWNDTDHSVGDNALRLFAQGLVESTRENDLVSRGGDRGDEFNVLLIDAEGSDYVFPQRFKKWLETNKFLGREIGFYAASVKYSPEGLKDDASIQDKSQAVYKAAREQLSRAKEAAKSTE